MSMADDNTVRSYRSNDPHRRSSAAGAAAPPHSDPLAELARLIGQTDPFAEFAAGNARRQAEPQTPAVPPNPTEWRRSTPLAVAPAEPPATEARPAAAASPYQPREPYRGPYQAA